ncbi:MAG: Ppx/GppA family phosphatase [Alphaproteobacteria bacterium]|nr:Ppx/GppA family phosphatase [Alphaproteobacteria bacterium]MDE2341150.1 Ppx/GppA family phosphatase [Alphaproteobacteria bacterium]
MTATPTSAIIDLGSNSVRLVVYGGASRAPTAIFNEKVLAGLGVQMAETGRLPERGMKLALATLRRYRLLTQEMGIAQVRTVATAAVRDAANRAEFVAQVEALGLPVEVISGEQEAVAAGYGVISGIPDADGFVGDLGGGSLELVRVCGGEVHERVSLPLGVLRLMPVIAKGRAALAAHIEAALVTAGWGDVTRRLPFYLVGGSWRALARCHILLTSQPLAVLHQYQMPTQAGATLGAALARQNGAGTKSKGLISVSRLPTLGGAAAILDVVESRLKSSALIISAYGLREGLLYQGLPEVVRRDDPLLVAARHEGATQGRFAQHGDLINDWIAPLFAEEGAAAHRLRHAACLLGDIGWHANPDFRAERGLDAALHGSWVAVDANGRAQMAQALFTAFGGGQTAPAILARVASPDDLSRAVRWGLAIRLGQRLSAGLEAPLRDTRLILTPDAVVLRVKSGYHALAGDVVERRLKVLANSLKRRGRIDHD